MTKEENYKKELVFMIKIFMIDKYFKLLTLFTEKWKCMHQIQFAIGFLCGGFVINFLLQQNYIASGLIAIFGIILNELFSKYFTKEQEILVVAQTKHENDDEFIANLQGKLIKTLQKEETKKKK